MRRFAAAAMLAALLPGAAAAVPASVELQYDVRTVGLTALALRFEIAYEASRYRVAADLETRGMIGFLVPWQMKATASGDRLRPSDFVSSSALYGTTRTTRMVYGADGTIAASADPPPERDDRDPVPADLMRGSVDVLTALLRVANEIERSGRCDVVVPVYDGRRRFDFVFVDAGDEPAAFAEVTMARRCIASVRKLAGFLKKPTAWDDDGGRAAAVVVGRLGADMPLLPMRLDMETPFGTARAELAGMRVNGVPRQLLAKR